MRFVRRLGLPVWMDGMPWSVPEGLLGPRHGSADAEGLFEALGRPRAVEAALQLSGPGLAAFRHVPEEGSPLEVAWRVESFLRLWDGDPGERALLSEAAPEAEATLWLELTPWERHAPMEGRTLSLWAKNGVPMSTPVRRVREAA